MCIRDSYYTVKEDYSNSLKLELGFDLNLIDSWYLATSIRRLIKNNNTEIIYLKDYNNFKLKFKSNYAVYSKIPDYGDNLSLLSKF